MINVAVHIFTSAPPANQSFSDKEFASSLPHTIFSHRNTLLTPITSLRWLLLLYLTFANTCAESTPFLNHRLRGERPIVFLFRLSSLFSNISTEPPPKMPRKVQAHGYSGKDLVLASLPRLETTQYRTREPSIPPSTGSSSSQSRWNGDIAHWVGFEREVLEAFEARMPRDDHDLLLLPQHLNLNNLTTDESYVGVEHLLCGEEKGVEGRFNHQVSHVMTCVAKDNGIPLRFGDWKASATSTTAHFSRLPDCSATDAHRRVVFLGEVKADWDDRIRDMLSPSGNLVGLECRRWLGQ